MKNAQLKPAILTGLLLRMKVILILCLFCDPHSHAAQLNFKSGNYTKTANNEPLTDVLAHFFTSQGYSSRVSKKIENKLSAPFEGPPQKFLQMLEQLFGIIWYYDGDMVYVYSRNEAVSKMIELEEASYDLLLEKIKNTNIYDPRFPVKASGEKRFALVSGPPKYVFLVSQTAKGMRTQEVEKVAKFPGDHAVRVFPLKYAWAGDISVLMNNERVELPGMATLLQSIFGLPKIDNSAKYTQAPARKLKGLGMANTAPEVGAYSEPRYQDKDIVISMEAQPIIAADHRLNALVIKDVPDNMPSYRNIIHSLDRPSGLVEISATIIDMDYKTAQSLGISWKHTWSREGDPQALEVGSDPSLELNMPAPSAGYSTILSGSLGKFMGKVKALEERGKAKIVSHPQVLTLDNMEARINNNEEFYIRVAGQEEVDLFKVEAGINMQVTPHIINDEYELAGSKIRLAVQIEDGVILDNTEVDNIPRVRKSLIQTQAVIGEGQSLLLGGIIREIKSNSKAGVPWLSRIPILGLLFSQSSRKVEKVERLFMITPNVVTHEALQKDSAFTTNIIYQDAFQKHREDEAK